MIKPIYARDLNTTFRCGNIISALAPIRNDCSEIPMVNVSDKNLVSSSNPFLDSCVVVEHSVPDNELDAIVQNYPHLQHGLMLCCHV